MNHTLVFLDDEKRSQLFPFTRTRSAADIRCGIFTARERWQILFKTGESETLTHETLQPLYPITAEEENKEGYTILNSRLFAIPALLDAIQNLTSGSVLRNAEGTFLAACLPEMPATQAAAEAAIQEAKSVEIAEEVLLLNRIWEIFSENGKQIKSDFEILTKGRLSNLIPAGVVMKNNEQIFLEEGAKIGLGVLLNAGDGPIYIGKNAEVMDGAMLRGPVALGEGAVVKMGAKIYGDTTIGPGCKVGGEVSNTVFFANSNKGHDGFLGNAVVGEWCNLGADTNASNLKNNYDKVKIHDDATDKRLVTGLTFCGLLMGDHSKCGINTMFNTGTVVGVSCNIYGGEFPPSYIPSFSWGGAAGFKTYAPEKALDTANRMMERRGKSLSEAETAVLEGIFKETAAARTMHHAKAAKTAE